MKEHPNLIYILIVIGIVLICSLFIFFFFFFTKKKKKKRAQFLKDQIKAISNIQKEKLGVRIDKPVSSSEETTFSLSGSGEKEENESIDSKKFEVIEEITFIVSNEIIRLD